jgi:hypothetical protein
MSAMVELESEPRPDNGPVRDNLISSSSEGVESILIVVPDLRNPVSQVKGRT